MLSCTSSALDDHISSNCRPEAINNPFFLSNTDLSGSNLLHVGMGLFLPNKWDFMLQKAPQQKRFSSKNNLQSQLISVLCS